MNKALMLLLAGTFAAGVAHAGTYSIQQESACPLVTPGDLWQTVHKVGVTTGLDLPKDMALRAELRCTSNGKAAGYVYTFRATIEKQLADGEQQRWAPVVQVTGFGTSAGSTAMLRQVGYTVRDLIRQEP